MEVIRDKNVMRDWSRNTRLKGERICLVPTMGYLHRGHVSLVEEAKSRASRVVVSIYINPAQFAVGEDFSTYPSNFEGDLAKLKSLGVDAVFNPADLYEREARGKTVTAGENDNGGHGCATSCLEEKGGNGHQTWIRVEKLEQPLCGKSRPIFFRGVATVVAKLLNIVEPDVAVFGKKDYQQWRLIRRMARDLDFAVEIIGSEIVRDSDGLALSSRNVRLSSEERQKALSISRALYQVRDAVCNGEISTGALRHSVVEAILSAGGRIDYVEHKHDKRCCIRWLEIVDQETLQPMERIDSPVVLCVAAWFGGVRLIDNIELQASGS